MMASPVRGAATGALESQIRFAHAASRQIRVGVVGAGYGRRDGALCPLGG